MERKSLFIWWFTVGLGVGTTHCGSPMDPNAAHEASPARDPRSTSQEAPAAPTSTRSVDQGLQLPPIRRRDVSRRDLVANRVYPSESRITVGSGESHALFDHNPNTAPTPDANGNLSVSLRHESPALLGIRVRGPARGTLTVATRNNNDNQETVVGEATSIDATDGTWRSINFQTPITNPSVVLRWAGQHDSNPLGEIELWGQTPESVLRPERWLADRLATSNDGASRLMASPAAQEISFVERQGAEFSGEFTVPPVANASLCSRAFLQYELEGATSWTGIEKSINGTSLGTPQRAVATRSAGIQLEEFSPTLLTARETRIKFDRNLTLGAAGYRIRNLSLLCVNDTELASGDRDQESHTLIDDDRTTAVQGGQHTTVGPLSWKFSAISQPHALSFYLTDNAVGSIVLRADGQRLSHRTPLSAFRAGWNSVLLPDSIRPSDRYWVEANVDRESSGRVSEVRLAGSPVTTPAQQPELVVTYPHHGECFDSTIHARGYLRGVNGDGWNVRLLNRSQSLAADGIFAINSEQLTNDAQDVEIVATNESDPQAPRVSATIHLTRCLSTPTTPVTARAQDDVGAPFAVTVQTDRASTLDVGDFRLEIPRGSVAATTRVTLRPLAQREVPALEGLTNVTRGARAYRLGPHPMQFLAPLKLTIPIDSSALPAGKTLDDVSVYYFDDGAQRWREVPRDVGVRPETVTATTDHFTDFIAATGVFLDNGEGGVGDQNSMGSTGGGNPLAGVGNVAPPGAGPSGDAATGLTLSVSPGRHGMQPQVRIQYASSAGNGFLGVGWSLSLSSITIDTRFGVPNYLDEPSYLLDGQPLVPAGAPISPCEQRFEPRVLGSNLRIIRDRCNGETKWKVTDPSGTVSTYGGSANSRLCAHPGASIAAIPLEGRTPIEHCSTWAIWPCNSSV